MRTFIERDKARGSDLFKKLSKLWNRSDYSKENYIGNLDYLISGANAYKKKEGLLDFDTWVDFYFKTGVMRLNKPDTSTSRISHGRTKEELNNYANELKNLYKEEFSEDVHINDVRTVITMLIFDDTYKMHLIKQNGIDALKRAYPKCVVINSAPADVIRYGVDAAVLNSERNRILALFTIRDENFNYLRLSKKNPQLREFIKIGEKHNFCKESVKVKPQWLIVSASGIIKSPILGLR